MKEQLLKAMQRNQLVDKMYMAKSGEISKRRIKVMMLTENTFQAFCFNRNAKRTFNLDCVLALIPVYQREHVG